MLRSNKVLWTVQIVLAAIFLLAGGVKLVTPVEQMQQGPIVLPGWFLRFVGVAEVLGAIGLILPGLLRIQVQLTPLAATGLMLVTLGATVTTLWGGMGAVALLPFVVSLLSAWVAWARSARA
ncbi:MAG: DoxX family protein [Vicinamibacterales bacterium]